MPSMQTKPTTVIQVLPSLNSGGVERGTLEIAKALVTEGYRSLVISSGGALVKQLQQEGSTHIKLPVDSKNPIVMLCNARSIKKIAEANHADILHVRSRAPAWSVYFARKKLRCAMVTTFHGIYGHANSLKRTYNSAMLKGDKVIAVSDYVQQHIRDTYPKLAKDQLVRIYRGIDTALFSPESITQASVNALAKRWGIDRHRPVIMLPGRLTRLKGHRLLIDALAILDMPGVQCLIVGATEGRENYLQELKQHAAKHQLKASLHFVGRCDNMPEAYALADIIVSASSKAESFGRTNCEAQAMGRAVVASRLGGTLETTAKAQHGGLFEAGRADSLARALGRALARTEDEQKHIAAASRQHIVQHFSLDKMTHQTIELYRSLVSPV